jgi:hypothetical protein
LFEENKNNHNDRLKPRELKHEDINKQVSRYEDLSEENFVGLNSIFREILPRA